MRVKNIPIELIKYPKVILRSPEDMTGIDDLAKSIATDGLLNPLTVRERGEEYELLAGGRRFEAIKTLGWDKVPCNVVSPNKEREAIITLIENQKRADLNPLEEAQYYEYLHDELGYTQEQIGELTGTTAAHVNQMLKLLTLDEYSMGALVAGDISASQARELARCPDISYRQYLVDIIRKSGASVLMLKRWVDQRIGQITTEEKYEPLPSYVETAESVETRRNVCDACGSEVEYGGLQAMMLCNECFKVVKGVVEHGSEGEGEGES
jgi:ParB family chromosome partitioning protein